MTLDERIERVAESMLERWPDEYKPAHWAAQTEKLKDALRKNAREILAAAFPELFTDPPSAWLAPWEASPQMADRWTYPDARRRVWASFRDAHLNPNRSEGGGGGPS